MLAGLPRSGNWMVRVNRVLATLMVLASAYYGSLWYKKINVGSPKSVVTLSAIHWLSNEIEAAEKAKALNKPIFIDFAAEWCEACHVIEKTVFTDAAVAAELNSRFITLRIDVTESNEINEQILQKYGVLSLPTLVFVSPNGTILKTPRVHGVITAKEFLQILKTHF